MDKFEVVGVYVFETQKGTIGTLAYLMGEFDEYKRANAKKCDGAVCFEEYFRGDLSAKLKVGAEVTIVYGKGFGGKAVAVDVIPVA